MKEDLEEGMMDYKISLFSFDAWFEMVMHLEYRLQDIGRSISSIIPKLWWRRSNKRPLSYQ
jgi:hypothetical protein